MTGKRPSSPRQFISEGGEMGELIRNFDWSSTSLGPPDMWPLSLKTSVSLILRSGYPMFIWWGPDLIMFHNDAYLPVLGKKHPEALGKSARVMWQEIWEQVGPMVEDVFNGQQIFKQDLLMFLGRKGYAEETYFTFSYSPIIDDDGAIGGLFCACNEETQKILGERRLKTLKDISVLAPSLSLSNPREICNSAIEIIKQNPNDIPFATIYLLNEEVTQASLASQTHEQLPEEVFPLKVDIGKPIADVWHLNKVHQTAESYLIKTLHPKLADLSGNGPGRSASAIVMPLQKSGKEKLAGFMIFGLSGHLEFNDAYRSYLDLLSGQLSSVMANTQAFEEERRRGQALAELDRAKTVFFGNVSHEFRTPLTLMLGPLEELKNQSFGAVVDQSIDIAYRNALRLLKLVNALLDFSRIESGKVKAELQAVNLSELTEDLASNFRSAFEKAGVALTIHCQRLAPVFVDQGMWEKIVLNLLSNALKYTLKGEVRVTLEEASGAIVLTVKDSGIGIRQEDIPHLFKRFYRASQVEGRTFEGTGIGLALVKELVQLNKGRIEVESEYGVGTTFRVKIPAKKSREIDSLPSRSSNASITSQAYVQEAMQWMKGSTDLPMESEVERMQQVDDIATAQNGGHVPHIRKDHILLVDDNADMREYVRRLLQSEYHVQVASNGAEALAVIEQRKPDLIISDVMMPVVDGFTLLKRVKDNPLTMRIPLILLSARAGEESVVDGLRTGADDYLVKPFSPKQLVTKVATHLKISKAHSFAEKQIRNVFMEAPAPIAILKGREGVCELVNTAFRRLWRSRNPEGKSMRDAWPELEGQGYFEMIEEVYRTGVSRYGVEVPVKTGWSDNGNLKEAYFNFVYVPSHDLQGNVDGVIFFGYEVTDQVLARKKAEENEVYFKKMTDNVPVMVWMTNSEGDCVFLNKQWYDFTGQREGEAFGKEWLAAVYPDEVALTTNVFLNANQNKSPFKIIYRLRRHDGEYRWMMDSGMPRFADDGTFDGYIGCVIDIHERKTAEDRVHEEELRFRQMADSLPQIIWTARPDGYLDYYNKRWYQYTGFGEDYGDKSWVPLLHPDDVRLCYDRWYHSVETGEPYEIKYRFKDFRNPGTYRWFLGRALAIKDSNNQIIKWFGSCTDIDDVKRAEDALKESEERFRLVADSAPAMIWMTATDKRCVFINKQWIDFAGASSQEMCDDILRERIHPDDVQRFEKLFNNAVDATQPFHVEYRLRRLDGQYRWVVNHGVPRFSLSKQFEGYIGSCIDIHEKKMIEEELERRVQERTHDLQEANIALEKSNLELEQFAYVASHDLQEPLRKIQLFSEFLDSRKHLGEDELQSYIAKIQSSAGRMSVLIKDLLNFSRLSVKEEWVPVDMNRILAEVKNDFEVAIAQKKATIKADELPTIHGILLQINQLFHNLLSNSLKFSRAQPVVEIRYRPVKGDEVVKYGLNPSVHYVEIIFKDNGIGFEPQYADQIFTIFQRLNNKSDFSGTGIGLALCKKIVDNHHGFIYAQSQPNEGASFFVILPQENKSY